MGRFMNKLEEYGNTISKIMTNELYSNRNQKYKVRVGKSFLEEENLAEWFEISINNTFSLEEMLISNDDLRNSITGKYAIEFSFSDLQDATLFRLRF